jgi:hypothetical protein
VGESHGQHEGPDGAGVDFAGREGRPTEAEALFAGISSGANVVAALEVAKRLGPRAKVVTLMVDSGLKYLNTDVYRKRVKQ